MAANTPEGRISAYIKQRVREMGGDWRKLSYEARIGAPDLLLLFPGYHLFVEVKREGEEPRVSQFREIYKLQNAGTHATWVAGKEEAKALMDSLEDRMKKGDLK